MLLFKCIVSWISSPLNGFHVLSSNIVSSILFGILFFVFVSPSSSASSIISISYPVYTVTIPQIFIRNIRCSVPTVDALGALALIEFMCKHVSLKTTSFQRLPLFSELSLDMSSKGSRPRRLTRHTVSSCCFDCLQHSIYSFHPGVRGVPRLQRLRYFIDDFLVRVMTRSRDFPVVANHGDLDPEPSFHLRCQRLQS